uniref:DUF6303 family protein n=1 Tax=Streptomyces sp. NBC_01401 TaxID=2903854 RepID=A0AAU3GTR3_9ACTN
MTKLPQARMAIGMTGTWVLYVLTDVPFLEWPGHDFHRAFPMPTPQERTQALSTLGYAPVDGAEWEWTEARHASVAAHLWAAITVRPLVNHPAMIPTGGAA